MNRGINDRVHKIKRIASLTVAPAPPGRRELPDHRVRHPRLRHRPGRRRGVRRSQRPNTRRGQRSDTLMVAHVEPRPQQTFVVSFPRDLMVDVPACRGRTGSTPRTRLGGARGSSSTRSRRTSTSTSTTTSRSTSRRFQKIVDAIGSVARVPPRADRDQETGLATGPVTGLLRADGPTALAYVRSRSIEIARSERQHRRPTPASTGDCSTIRADLDRIGRQQHVHPQAGGARDLQEPERSHPGRGAHRQRPRVHQRRPEPEPRRRQRARPGRSVPST